MTHSQRRDVLKAAGTVAVIGGLAGCAEDEEPLEDEEGEAPTEEPEETQEEEQEDDVGAFRVAHASPDAPNVDVYFDDQAVIEDLEFREVSPYEEVEPDSYQVQVTAADDPDAVVFDEEVEVEGGVTNTAVAFGEAAGGPENEFTVEILEDDISEPGEDTSRVRFFHASPDAEEVDIVVAEAPEEIEEDDEEAEDEELPENDQPQPPEGETEETQQEDEPPEDEAEDEPPEDENEEMPDDEPEEDEEDEPAEEPQVGEPLFEGVGFGDDDTQEIPAGDYTLEVVPAEEDPEEEDEDEEMPDEEPEEDEDEDEPTETQQEDEDEAEDEPPEDEDEEMPDDEPEEDEDEPAEEPVDEFELSTESQTVYSAFAVGYVEPPEEGDEDEEDEEENDDGLLQDGENEEFEVVIVEDASEGERADGGTNGNGLLTLQH